MILTSWLLALIPAVVAADAAVPRVNCPRLQALNASGICADALKSCQLTRHTRGDCRSPSSCECMSECEAQWFLQGGPPCFFTNGTLLASLDDALTKQWYSYRRRYTVQAGAMNVPESEEPLAGQPTPPPRGLMRLADCPNSCNQRGWCITADGASQASCRCFEPWEGHDCSEPSPPNRHYAEDCLNKCSGRGRCQAGVCLCAAGSWGVDCSLPLAQEQADAFVYVYELPPGFNAWWPATGLRAIARPIHEYLLRSPFRTTDPAKAAVFWVPVEPMAVMGMSFGMALLALDFVRREYPHYNQSQGHDHAIVYGWDSGSCWIARHPLAINTIQVSSFGLEHPSSKMFCNCALCGAGFTLLVPDMMEQRYKKRTLMRYGQRDTSPRPTWLYFAGHARSGDERIQLFNVTGSAAWSAAAAAAAHAHGAVHIIDSSTQLVDLFEGMSKARFCLAPPGQGFGTRGTLAILLGCVPVYVGDMREPWDDMIDYSTFSLRVAVSDLPQLLDRLAAADYEALRRGLGDVWHKFSWASVLGPIGGEPLEQDALHLMLMRARQQAQQRNATGTGRPP